MAGDLSLLQGWGELLEVSPVPPIREAQDSEIWEPRNRDLLIESLLRIRSKKRHLVVLSANRAQREYSRRCTKRNIVLKARQLGITTYVAARFFMQTITHPGTVTVQVAHDQDSAEEIFRIVHRFWNNLPEPLQRGVLVRSRANVQEIVFRHWHPFTQFELQAEREEVLGGQGDDLDEVLRELQGRIK